VLGLNASNNDRRDLGFHGSGCEDCSLLGMWYVGILVPSYVVSHPRRKQNSLRINIYFMLMESFVYTGMFRQ